MKRRTDLSVNVKPQSQTGPKLRLPPFEIKARIRKTRMANGTHGPAKAYAPQKDSTQMMAKRAKSLLEAKKGNMDRMVDRVMKQEKMA